MLIRSVTAAAFGLAILLSSNASWSSAASTALPYGVWTSQERDVRVRLSDCAGKICGTLVWLQEQIDRKTGKPKTDKLNPDPAKRARRLIGIQVVNNFVRSGPNRWSGTIYNADDGHIYRAHISMLGPRTLRLKGCMLVVLCMGHTWHRVDHGVAGRDGGPPPTASHGFNVRTLLRGVL